MTTTPPTLLKKEQQQQHGQLPGFARKSDLPPSLRLSVPDLWCLFVRWFVGNQPFREQVGEEHPAWQAAGRQVLDMMGPLTPSSCLNAAEAMQVGMNLIGFSVHCG